MRFRDIRIGVRINAGYAMLIVLMLVVIVLSGSRIYAIRAETDNILQRDWVAAKATSKIHGLAREAATRIASLPEQHKLALRRANQERLEAIKQGIDDQVRVLDGLKARAEERRLLEQMHGARADYYASLQTLFALLAQGDDAGAEQAMQTQTLPVLEKVLLYVGQLDDLQQQQIRDSADRIRNDIDTSLTLMGGIGLAALLVCLMTWAILRRTTAGARVLDASFATLKSSQDALATSEARFRDVVEASSDWVWEIDRGGRFTYLSDRFDAVTGLSGSSWIGESINALLSTELGTLTQWLSIPNRRPDISILCYFADSQGRQRITRLSARDMAGKGFRGTATDVTEEVEARRRIEFLSQHDALTGLPNRTRLQEFLDGKLKAVPTAEQPLVMLSLDLDRFKPVNDLLGHAAGDFVLNEVSSRLADCIRNGDLVARVGGDEFVLILTDVSSQDEVEALCQRLIESIEGTVVVGDQEVFVSASIGIAMAPNDACEAAELLRYADIALYEAKAAGRNTWRFYAGEMNARIIERRRLENDLRFAIRHGELKLHFQPRYRIADGQMVGAEALVRGQHPERGLVPPDVFIPIAEESGLILSLSNWVLDTACHCAVLWPEHLFVSVNLSSTEFKRGNLVERIQKALKDSGIDPGRVELEITESVMLEDASGALEVMRTLKRLGVRISMDDFGTGYSSLSYLRAFPFDGLKIDRSFLNRLDESEDDKAIIRAIVGLGRALSLTVTAEGIETAEHLKLLKAVSCDEGQGYYLSRPLDVDAFNDLVSVSA